MLFTFAYALPFGFLDASGGAGATRLPSRWRLPCSNSEGPSGTVVNLLTHRDGAGDGGSMTPYRSSWPSMCDTQMAVQAMWLSTWLHTFPVDVMASLWQPYGYITTSLLKQQFLVFLLYWSATIMTVQLWITIKLDIMCPKVKVFPNVKDILREEACTYRVRCTCKWLSPIKLCLMAFIVNVKWESYNAFALLLL